MTRTSDGMFFPSPDARSRARLTERSSASFSIEPPSYAGSAMRSIFAVRWGRSAEISFTRARHTPCTRTRMRSSGSLSMRMMTATVPIS